MSYARDRITQEMLHGNQFKTLNNANAGEIFDWWNKQPSPQSQASKRNPESRVEYAVQEAEHSVAVFHHLVDPTSGEVFDTCIAVFIKSQKESAQWLAALLNNNSDAQGTRNSSYRAALKAQQNGGKDAQRENKR